MKEKNIVKALATAGLAGLASILPGKANAQSISGWFEATSGTPSENLRLYPRASLGPLNIQSLIDLNDSWKFNKTDLYSPNLENKFGNFGIKPVLTFFQDPTGKRIMPGINVAYSFGSFFGFTEMASDELNTDRTKYYTYNGIAGEKGSCAIFLTSPFAEWKTPYTEVECTGPGFKGVAPYVRTNLDEGVEPTYQIGVSINPGKLIGK